MQIPRIITLDQLDSHWRKSCIGYFKCGPSGYRELITGLTPTVTGTPTYQPGVWGGYEMVCTGSEAVSWTLSDLLIEQLTSQSVADFSIICFVSNVSTSGSAKTVFGIGASNGTNCGVALKTEQSTFNDPGYTKGGVDDARWNNLATANITKYIAVSLRNDIAYGFVDEGEQADADSNSHVWTSADTVSIGGVEDNPLKNYYIGNVSDVIVFNRGLSDAEMRAIVRDPRRLEAKRSSSFFLFGAAAGGQSGTSADSANLSDTTSATAAAAGTSAETLNLSDATSGASATSQTATDSASLSDTASGQATAAGTSAEIINLSDVTSATVTSPGAGTSSESLSLSDTVSATALAAGVSAEVINFSEALSGTVPSDEAGTSAEGLTLTDTVTATTSGWAVQPNESTTWTEQTNATTTWTVQS